MPKQATTQNRNLHNPMKISLPNDYSQITVGQYKAIWKMYEREEDAYHAQRRCIELLADLEEGALQNASWESIEVASATLNWLIDDPDPFALKMPLINTFELHDVKYGFIPDWTKLTVGEYADLETFCKQGVFEVLEKLCAIVFRPIVSEKNDRYTIESYQPDEKRSEAMLDLPMNIAVAAMVFFSHIEKELATTMQRYLKKAAKENPTLFMENGVGTA